MTSDYTTTTEPTRLMYVDDITTEGA